MAADVPSYLGPDELARIIAVDEFEPLARSRLEPTAYGFIAGAAGTGATARANLEAFSRYVFLPRVMVDVSAIDLHTSILGRAVDVPILIAPSALQRLAHPDGELAMARAANETGSLMCISTSARTAIEEVAAVARAPWFQLYWLKDQELTRDLVERATAAGCCAIVVTVDAAVPLWRDNELRLPLVLPAGVRSVNLPEPSPGVSPSVTWRSLEWLRTITDLPIVLKGIVTAEDTRLAIDHRIDAIIVSNHGGRALDGTIASLDALPDVVDAASGRIEIYVDGGVRRGTDVLKALALGARAVFVGRPALWALAAGGERGVTRLFELLRGELVSAMGLCGCRTLAEVTSSIIRDRADRRSRPGG